MYFVEYSKPARGGKGNVTLAWYKDCIKAYDRYDKEVSLDLSEANIIKIYDIDSSEDFTEMIMKKHEEVERVYGTRLPFPFTRRVEYLE